MRIFFPTVIQLQFDMTDYTFYEAEGLVNDMIRVTKAGRVSEVVLEAVVQVVVLTPNSAEIGKY